MPTSNILIERLILIVLGLQISICSSGFSQSFKSSNFIFRLGVDTVAYERYRKTHQKIEGDILYVSPRATIVHYVANLDQRGFVRKYVYRSRYVAMAETDVAVLERVAEIQDTLVTQEFFMNGSRDTMGMSGEFSVPLGSVPLQDFSVAMYEQLIDQARAAGKDSIAFYLFTNGPLTSYIKKIGNYRYKSTYFFLSSPVFLETDVDGHVIRYDATATTVKFIADRSSHLDIPALASRFAAVGTDRICNSVQNQRLKDPT